MSNPTIGHRLFVDGTRRPIYEDGHGQYVLDDDGERVCGVYLDSVDEGCDLPVIVTGNPHAEP
jgi:hypothetical protein